MKKLVIFASGAGSNAQRIDEYFQQKGLPVQVALILSNNPQAGVLARAEKRKIPTLVFNRETFFRTDFIPQILRHIRPDLIVLAGFLWKIPEALIQAFPQKIINIHPSLLPQYGGKGMYGMHVHRAVIAQGETHSGISIHYVNEQYDQGQLICQASTPVAPTDTPQTLAEKIHALEYEYFPKTIEKLLFKF